MCSPLIGCACAAGGAIEDDGADGGGETPDGSKGGSGPQRSGGGQATESKTESWL